MRKLVFIILAFLPIFLIVTIGIASKVLSQKTHIYVESVVFTDEDENEYPSDKIIRLNPSSTYQLHYKIYPELATNQKVTFYSDNTELVIVNSEGKLSVATDDYGTAYITLQTDCGNKTIKILIYVVGQKVLNLTLPTEYNVKVGWKNDLDLEIYPHTATNKKVYWESSDVNVCKVDLNGVVTAVGPGTAIIKATSDDDPSIQATTTINVTESADIIFKNPNDNYFTSTNQFDVRTLIQYINPEYEDDLQYKIIYNAQFATLNGSILTFENILVVKVEITLVVGDDLYASTYTIFKS